MADERKSRAKPRVAGGYVDVPRVLYDAILAAPFNAAQLKVVAVIVRLTWGYFPAENCDGAAISRATIARRSGLSADTVHKTLSTLVREGVVEIVRRGAGRRPNVMRLSPDPSNWGRFEPVGGAYRTPLEELSTELSTGCPQTGQNRPEKGRRGGLQTPSEGAYRPPLQPRMNFPLLNFQTKPKDLKPSCPNPADSDDISPTPRKQVQHRISGGDFKRLGDLYRERTP